MKDIEKNMDSKKICEHIDNFFKNATPEQLEEVNKAFSVEIPGDITMEEYIESFNDHYSMFQNEDDDEG